MNDSPVLLLLFPKECSFFQPFQPFFQIIAAFVLRCPPANSGVLVLPIPLLNDPSPDLNKQQSTFLDPFLLPYFFSSLGSLVLGLLRIRIVRGVYKEFVDPFFINGGNVFYTLLECKIIEKLLFCVVDSWSLPF